MAIIYCNLINKSLLLLSFIFILHINVSITFFLTDVYPLKSDFFDSINQFLIYIPYFLWKKIKKKKNMENKHLAIPIIKKEKLPAKKKNI